MRKDFNIIIKFIKPYIKKFVVCQFYMVVATVAGLAFPWALKTLLDSAFDDKEIKILLLSIGFLGVVFIIKGIFNYLKTCKMATISNNLVKDIRRETYKALQKKSLRYYDNKKSGDIVSSLTNDIMKVQSTITNGAVNMIQSVIKLVTVVTTLFVMEPLLASITVGIIPVIVIISKSLGKKVKPISQMVRVRLGSMTSIINESISGINIIKLFGLEKHAESMFKEENKKLVKSSIKERKLKARNSLYIGLLYSLQFLIVIALGSYKVFQGVLTPGSLIAFVLYGDMIAGPISRISGIYMEIKSASAALDRLKVILNDEFIIQESGRKDNNLIKKGNIQFNNVTFSYDNNKRVLKDINFNIPSGTLAAFVGKSGVGKSTVMKLIPRFYEINRGDIFIDNKSIKDYSISKLRERIAIVPQECFLFGMSIKENILCGNPDASFDEVINAAKNANAHDFIMDFKNGYETVAGERGAQLSGGQRQRIAIARAFIKSPKILLLDEATSALDNESEAEVQEAIFKLMEGRTTIVIAHRLSTIKNADVIFVMDEGKIIQKGTHDELLKVNGVYKSLFNKIKYDNIA